MVHQKVLMVVPFFISHDSSLEFKSIVRRLMTAQKPSIFEFISLVSGPPKRLDNRNDEHRRPDLRINTSRIDLLLFFITLHISSMLFKKLKTMMV